MFLFTACINYQSNSEKMYYSAHAQLHNNGAHTMAWVKISVNTVKLNAAFDCCQLFPFHWKILKTVVPKYIYTIFFTIVYYRVLLAISRDVIMVTIIIITVHPHQKWIHSWPETCYILEWPNLSRLSSVYMKILCPKWYKY